MLFINKELLTSGLFKVEVSIRHSRGLMLVIYKQGAINQWIIEKNLVEVIKREPLSYTSPLGVDNS